MGILLSGCTEDRVLEKLLSGSYITLCFGCKCPSLIRNFYLYNIMMKIDVRNANKVNLRNLIDLLRKAYQTLVNKGYTLETADMILVNGRRSRPVLIFCIARISH